MKKLLLCLMLLGCSVWASATTVYCTSPANSQAPICPLVTTSATVVSVSNLPLTFNATFEEVFTGSPASVTVTIVGVNKGGTQSGTLDSNTSTSSAVRYVNSTTVVYTSYLVTASWTGGTNVTFQLNPVLSTARNGSGGGGGGGFTTAAQVVAAFAGCLEFNTSERYELPRQFWIAYSVLDEWNDDDYRQRNSSSGSSCRRYGRALASGSLGDGAGYSSDQYGSDIERGGSCGNGRRNY